MKILSWNIRQGGGKRAENIADAVIKERADIVVLSEFRNNDSGSLIRIKLLLAGYLHQSVGDSKASTNTVLIASKVGGTLSSFAHTIDDFPHALLRLQCDRLDVYGLYFPHKKKHTLFPFLLSELSKRNRSSVIVGDFNTGINGVDQKGSSFWYSEYLGKLEKQGFLDAYRHVHGDKRDYSWYSHGGNGFRYDHSWVSSDLVDQIGACDFEHDVRESEYSDHSMMVLQLAPQGA